MSSEINHKPNNLSSSSKNGCFVAIVLCIIFVVMMVTITFCGKISRESDARLCAEYGYQCEKKE